MAARQALPFVGVAQQPRACGVAGAHHSVSNAGNAGASRSSCVSRTVQRRATTDNRSEGRPNGRAEAPRLLLEGTGLKLVPVVEASPKPAAATRRRKPQAEPTIRWQEGTRSFFFSGGFEKAGGEAVLNAEGFPLLLFRGLLGNQALARACDLAAELHGAGQVIKQHELKAGKPRTIRRSLVHRLQPGASQPAAHAARSASSMLLDLILETLPQALQDSGSGEKVRVGRGHEFEDASLVFYRKGSRDFYEEHHDSWTAGDPPRARQRAFTVLVYLRSPEGPLRCGATEFTRLTRLLPGSSAGGGGSRTPGLVVKPAAGDALMWPNFDDDGKRWELALHRALAQCGTHASTSGTRRNRGASATGCGGKAVVNVWFS